MKFEFKAFTKEGKVKEGIITAKSKEEALKILQDQELLVTFLAEKKKERIFFKRATLKDLYSVTRQLAYLGSGGGVYILDVSNPSSPS